MCLHLSLPDIHSTHNYSYILQNMQLNLTLQKMIPLITERYQEAHKGFLLRFKSSSNTNYEN